MTVPIVTIFGGSGFIGRQVAQRMARAGWRVRVAVRRPNEANFVRPYGVVGQVEPIQANIRDEASTRAAIAGADGGDQLHRHPRREPAGRPSRRSSPRAPARIARHQRRGRRRPPRPHLRHRRRPRERQPLRRRQGPRARPRCAPPSPPPSSCAPRSSSAPTTASSTASAPWPACSPVLPLVGPETRFQPVYVKDVADAAVTAATTGAAPGVYELGGPEAATFRELMQRLLAHHPAPPPASSPSRSGWPASRPGSSTSRRALTRGLVENKLLTPDQVRLLAHDNVVSPRARGLAELGVAPTAMDAILETYLYVYRPHGQFDAIHNPPRTCARGPDAWSTIPTWSPPSSA